VIAQRNFAYYSTIPINIALILWVWIGRALFSAAGWWVLLFIFTVVPVLFIALAVTTILAIRQRQPASSGRVTITQFWCLLGLWVSLFLVGLFLVDFGDTKESERSAFTQVVGSSALDASAGLSGIFLLTSIVAYFGLLVALISGQQGRLDRKNSAELGGSGIAVPWPPRPEGWPPEPQAWSPEPQAWQQGVVADGRTRGPQPWTPPTAARSPQQPIGSAEPRPRNSSTGGPETGTLSQTAVTPAPEVP
jgi:hypothetical protein